jgi:hypothetical protein
MRLSADHKRLFPETPVLGESAWQAIFVYRWPRAMRFPDKGFWLTEDGNVAE